MWQHDVDISMGVVREELKYLRKQVSLGYSCLGRDIVLPKRCQLLLGELENEVSSWRKEGVRDPEMPSAPLHRVPGCHDLSALCGHARFDELDPSGKVN